MEVAHQPLTQLLAYATDQAGAATSHRVIPYVVVGICVLVGILTCVFAPDTVMTGSFVFSFLGSYLAVTVLSGLIFWGLYVYLPELTDANDTSVAGLSSHQTGIYGAIAFSVITFLVLISRMRAAQRARRRRGGLN